MSSITKKLFNHSYIFKLFEVKFVLIQNFSFLFFFLYGHVLVIGKLVMLHTYTRIYLEIQARNSILAVIDALLNLQQKLDSNLRRKARVIIMCMAREFGIEIWGMEFRRKWTNALFKKKKNLAFYPLSQTNQGNAIF